MGFFSRLGNKLATGTLAVTGTIYELGDAATFGALPNTIQGVQISNVGGGGTEKSVQQQVAEALAILPPTLTSGLPQAGTNVGQTVPNLVVPTFTQAIPAFGYGAGSGLEQLLAGIGRGAGQGAGDLAWKALLPIALVGGGLLVVLMVAGNKTGTTRAVSQAVR